MLRLPFVCCYRHAETDFALTSVSVSAMLRRWVYYGCLTAAVAVCYYNALQCDFVFDDVSAVKDNRDLRPHTPLSNLLYNDFWGTPMEKVSPWTSHHPLHLSYSVICLSPAILSFGLSGDTVHCSVTRD